MRVLRMTFGLLAGLAVALLAMPAGFATTSTASLAVSVSVSNNCSMNAGSLAFAAYTGAADTQSGTVSFSCTTGTPTSLNFSSLHNGGPTSRQLINGASALNYQLCADSVACGTVIPNNTAETMAFYSCATVTTTTTCNIFGSIAASQPASLSGSYSDTVTMTLTF